MLKAFLLEHSYEISYGEISYSETKTIGIYSTREKAESVVNDYINIIGFNKYPISCFDIIEYEINKNHWTEGFVSSDEI